jgi:16S rRNA (guanine1516-N2)-methyltransferase
MCGRIFGTRMSVSSIRGVGYTTPDYRDAARVLALKLDVALLEVACTPRLELGARGLFLCMPACTPMQVDFDATVRARTGPGIKKSALLRACKLKPGMRVLDATAGWGRDAAVLASTGAHVTLCEREGVLAALLEDGLTRLSHPTKLILDLIPVDARTYLEACDRADYPDVIYCDPMHPERVKSARVKKDLQALQILLGSDNNPEALLACARACAKLRVVVKSSARLPALMKPSYSVTGKTVRFDVYVS